MALRWRPCGLGNPERKQTVTRLGSGSPSLHATAPQANQDARPRAGPLGNKTKKRREKKRKEFEGVGTVRVTLADSVAFPSPARDSRNYTVCACSRFHFGVRFLLLLYRDWDARVMNSDASVVRYGLDWIVIGLESKANELAEAKTDDAQRS